MLEAKKAGAFFPFAPEIIENHPGEIVRYALDGLAALGVVDETTLELEIYERASLDGVVMPQQWAGVDIPDDWLIARATAWVIPHEETNDEERWDTDGGS